MPGFVFDPITGDIVFASFLQRDADLRYLQLTGGTLTGNLAVPSIKIGSSSTTGYVWTATDTNGNGSWQAASGGGGASPLTTKGDLFGYSTTNARIPIGTNGQVLTADSTVALGLKWATLSVWNGGTVTGDTDFQANVSIGLVSGTQEKRLTFYQGPNGTAGQFGYIYANFSNLYLGNANGHIVFDNAQTEARSVYIQETGGTFQASQWWFDGASGTGSGVWFSAPGNAPFFNLRLGVNDATGSVKIRSVNGNIQHQFDSAGNATIAGKASVGNLKIGATSTAGYVWTATDTVGNGSWQSVPAGGGGITQTQADARYVQSGPNGSDVSPVFGYIRHVQNGAASWFGIYAEDNQLYYGVSTSLPSPSGTSTLGGYYKGLGIGGSTNGTGQPIFGILNSAQSGNGNNLTAMTVYDDNRMLSYKNTLDDGAGKMSVVNLRIGTSSTTGYVWTATDAAGNGSWQAVSGGGGGGSYVDLTTNQEVGGRKTFTGDTVVSNLRYNANGFGDGKLLQSDSGGYTTWITPPWITQTQGDTRYLQLTGGTLTGALTGTDITASGRITAQGSMKLNTNSQSIFGSEDNTLVYWDGTQFIINPRNYSGTNTANVAIQSGMSIANGLTLTGGLTLNAQNIVTDTTTGLRIGTATGQKLGFFNATPIAQPGNGTDLGVVLSNLGLRASGTGYPITTSGSVAFSGISTLSGNLRYGVLNVTGATTITNTSPYYIRCTSTAAYNVTLPSVATAGLVYKIKKAENNTNAITVVGTIDGATNYVLSAAYKYVEVVTTTTAGVFDILSNN